MFLQMNESSDRHSIMRPWTVSVVIALVLAWAIVPAHAQGGFSSGSTGADGPFNPPGQVPAGTDVQGNCTAAPGCTVTVPLRVPPNHIFNFTTVTIGQFVTVKFAQNAANTPVFILAQGNVTINGVINVIGSNGLLHGGGVGGPGGFKGGAGGYAVTGLTSGTTGDGPGGGGGGFGGISGGGGGFTIEGINAFGASPQNGGIGGPRYGTKTLVPLIGGAGGGGGGAGVSPSGSGGGGGGAILIASSGTITFAGNTSAIDARGGNGFPSDRGAGGGSGGAIRLVANTITGRPANGLAVAGGIQAVNGGAGAPGFVRIEAFDLSGFDPNITPNTTTGASTALPQSAISPNAPRLRIASVAGAAAPASPVGSLSGPPDIVLPPTQTNPVDVVVQGANIPVGTVVQVTLTPEIGARSSVQGTLAGTVANSTTTVSLTLSTSMQSVVQATATIELSASAKPVFIDGQRVERIEVTASYGGASELTYITRSGKRIRKVY